MPAFSALAASAALVTIPALAASAADSHGAYTWHHFADLDGKDSWEGFDSVTFEITVDTSPGDESNVYWSNQFGFVDGSGAYTGMQNNGSYDENTFLFSVWDATEAKPGSDGSYCVEFGGEGEGMSCRIRHNWREGDRYQFTVAHEGDGWFGVDVDNLDDPNVAFKLGSIRNADGQDKIQAWGMVSWTEYFEHGATCTNQPFAQATFKNPVTVPATTNKEAGLTPHTGCGASTVEAIEGATIQRTGIGFPAKGGNSKQPPAISEGSDSIPGDTETATPPSTVRPDDRPSATPDDCEVLPGSPAPEESEIATPPSTDPPVASPDAASPDAAAPDAAAPDAAAPDTADDIVVPLVPVETTTVAATDTDSLARTGAAGTAGGLALAAVIAAGTGGALLLGRRKRAAQITE